MEESILIQLFKDGYNGEGNSKCYINLYEKAAIKLGFVYWVMNEPFPDFDDKQEREEIIKEIKENANDLSDEKTNRRN